MDSHTIILNHLISLNKAFGSANISATDMLIFTVSVIGTANPGSTDYSAWKINFYLMHAKKRVAAKWFPNFYT